MTEDIDTLLTIAEIAGVFVGFAALVAVLAGRDRTQSRYDDAFLLFHVVTTSVQVIAAALLPVALFRYGLSQSTVWQIASMPVFVLNWFVILLVNRVTQGYARTHSTRRAVSIAGWSLEPFYQIPLLLCIVGVWQGLAPAFYLTSVVVGVLQVMVLFIGLATSLIARDHV